MVKQILNIVIGLACLTSTALADNWLSWAEFDRDGENIQIYLSRVTEGEAGPVIQVTQRGMNLAPAAMETSDALWLAWVDRSNRFDYRLRYARLDPQTLNTLESGTLATSDRKTYGPSLGISPQGNPVLAWSGLDGKDEEIRLAEYSQGRWGPERPITDNEFPDTLPQFNQTVDGKLLLSWEQLNTEGIFTATYILPQNYVSAITNDAIMLSPAGAADQDEEQPSRTDSPVMQLPASLSARQERFLMGSRAPTLN